MNRSEISKTFAEFLESPYDKLRKRKVTWGKMMVGHLMPGVPPEIIHAAGMLPVALLGSNKPVSKVDAHMSQSICSLMRSNLEVALSGDLYFMDGIVLNHMCECARSMSQIWYDVFPTRFFDVVMLPKKLDSSPVVKARLMEELSRFNTNLEDFAGQKISNDSLKETISLYNQGRDHLRKLYAIKRDNPQLISSRDVFSAIKSSVMMPKEEHNNLLSQLLSELESQVGNRPVTDNAVKVVLVGMVIEPLDILDIIEEVGGYVVGDNLSIGSRLIASDVRLDGDPKEAIIDHHLASPAFSGYVDPRVDSRQSLLKLVEENQAEGVIFVVLFQCDLYVYDYPDLKAALDNSRIPNLLIQTDLWTTSLIRMRTQLQAFVERIRGV